jgi:hypothetical protein
MPKLSSVRSRNKDLSDWKDLSDEIGLHVIAALEAGGYIAFWHNTYSGLNVRVMYENDQETFAYTDHDEFRASASEITDWLKAAAKKPEGKKFSSTAYEKRKGR